MTGEELILQNLRHSERRYHLFKAILIVTCTIASLAFFGYQANRIVTNTNINTERTQKYIRCIILLPTSSFTGTAEKRARAIDNCSLQTKIPQKVN